MTILTDGSDNSLYKGFSRYKSHLISSGLSLIFLGIALCFLWLGYLLQNNAAPTLTVREVEIMSITSPPPPPPQTQNTQASSEMTMQIEGVGPALPMIDVKPMEIILDKPDMEIKEAVNTEWQSLEVSWEAFELGDLDSMPSLLTSLKVSFPRSLSRQNIDRVLVKLDVMIEESGRVTLISIVENPHPELVSEIQKLVRNSRFTPPTKDDQVVRTRFIWPIEISS